MKKRQATLDCYNVCYISHRGLFNNKDASENTFLAFKRTDKVGYNKCLAIKNLNDTNGGHNVPNH